MKGNEQGAFQRKLSSLRREPPPRERARAKSKPGDGALPAWLRRRLRRQPVGAAALSAGPLAARTPGEPESLTTHTNARGAFAARTLRYPLDGFHGAWSLQWVARELPELSLLGRDEALDGLDLTRSVYLDIETTGLSGGAGTIPFMVGLGIHRCDHFELWQGFLPGPEGEAALLTEVAARIAAAGSVVSFFGKSFDRHRLEDKMAVHGIPAPFAGRPHLDLFHPLKRLYRGAYPDMRLGTLERALCQVKRLDDLPGSFAPAAWFDYLAGRAHRLEAVFEHNRDDVLSLVTLAGHLCCAIDERRPDGVELEGFAWARARGLARLFAAARDHVSALEWVEKAFERSHEDTRELGLLRADLLRLSGRHLEALERYRELCLDGRDELSLTAFLQIAKLCEHRLRDYPRALEATQEARSLADALAGTARERALAGIERRLKRLVGKLAGASSERGRKARS